MAMDKSLLKSPRFIVRAVELIFSIIVLALAAAVVNSFGSISNVNFSLFVGLTSFLLCAFWVFAHFQPKFQDRIFIVIELILTSIYWVFWLAAAAAVSDTTSWANSWYGTVKNTNCDTLNGVNYGGYWCNGAVPTLRALCAFCWLTWFLWCGSLFFCIYDDAIKNKVLSSAKKGEETAAPTVTEAAPAPAAATNV